MAIEEIKGNFEVALDYVITYLKHINEDVVLENWDILRGNDWFTQTRRDIYKERLLNPYGD